MSLQRKLKQDPKEKLYQRIQIQLRSWAQHSFKQKNTVFIVEQNYKETEALFYQINHE